VSFYGLTAVSGNLQRWNRFVTHGPAPGDVVGNSLLVMHVASAGILMIGGALQLVPRVRDRFPAFHRYNGRVYMLTAVMASVAGLYLLWVRGTVGDLAQHLGATLDALLILVCAAMALRHAVRRDFERHRRWALRLFLVVSANLFLRVALFAILALFGPVGFDPTTFQGPLLTFLAFGQSLVPLAVLELYLRAKDGSGALRMAAAAVLFVLTLGMGIGIASAGAAKWVPQIRATFDTRKSLPEALLATIDSLGIDEAESQYRRLKTAEAANYNFEERELNRLGYQLMQRKKLKEAIRIFQLNVEAYPQSSNVYDSLGEAYMNDGDKPLAIANYQRSLELNPKNKGAVRMLRKLGTP
jgi:tetratricopeptide (TPR) repeat protein